MKRIFSIFLSIVLVMTAIPLGGFEAFALQLEEIPTLTITYKPGSGASGSSHTDRIYDGEEVTLRSASSLGFKKEGYEFVGWKIGSNIYIAGDSFAGKGDYTATAQWEKDGPSDDPSSDENENTYKVTYYPGEAGGSEVVKTYNYDENFTLISCPFEYENHEFNGWAYDEDIYPASTEVKAPNRDVSFTAQWKSKNSVEIEPVFPENTKEIRGVYKDKAFEMVIDNVVGAKAYSKSGSVPDGMSLSGSFGDYVFKMVLEGTPTKAGTYNFSVSYKKGDGKTVVSKVDYTITVGEEAPFDYIDSIYLHHWPTKTEYYLGDTVDLTGMKVTAVAYNYDEDSEMYELSEIDVTDLAWVEPAIFTNDEAQNVSVYAKLPGNQNGDLKLFQDHFRVTFKYKNTAEYTITYDPGEGNGTAVTYNFYSGEEAVLKSASSLGFKKEGHKFIGWKIGSKIYDAGDSFAGEGYYTAIAQWKKEGSSDSSDAAPADRKIIPIMDLTDVFFVDSGRSEKYYVALPDNEWKNIKLTVNGNITAKLLDFNPEKMVIVNENDEDIVKWCVTKNGTFYNVVESDISIDAIAPFLAVGDTIKYEYTFSSGASFSGGITLNEDHIETLKKGAAPNELFLIDGKVLPKENITDIECAAIDNFYTYDESCALVADLNKQEELACFDVVQITNVNIIEVVVEGNYSSHYNESRLEINATLNDVEHTGTMTFISDVIIFEYEEVKWAAANYKNNASLKMGGSGYSDYWADQYGYDYDEIRATEGASVISTTAFRAIEGKNIKVVANEAMTVVLSEIAAGQKGVNFSEYLDYDFVDEDCDYIWDVYYEDLVAIEFGFYCDQIIKGQYEIKVELPYNYYDLREYFGSKVEEDDIINYYIVDANNNVVKTIKVDYFNVDAEEKVAFTLNGENTSLGQYKLILEAPEGDDIYFAKGICGAESDGTNLSWTLNLSNVLTISGTGKMADYNGYDRPWEEYEDKIRHIKIENGVESIGRYAFFDFENLISVSIPDSVYEIGEGAFESCSSLKNVTIPEGVTTIEAFTFDSCTSLETVVLPKTLTHIEDLAFCNCVSIKNIELPTRLVSIGYDAFEYCKSLESIVIPERVTEIWYGAFSGCSKLSKVKIPKSVSNLDSSIFSGCNLKTAGPIGGGYDIEFAWTESISGSAFSYCSSLESVVIPEGIKSIGSYTFGGCTNLKEVIIGESVEYIGSSCFESCTSLKSIVLPENLKEVDNSCFKDCKTLETVKFKGNDVEYLGSSAFSGCIKLKNIVLPDNIYRIDSEAFYNCISLEKINMPKNLNSVEYKAFYNCYNLGDIEFFVGLEYIGAGAFDFCDEMKNVYFYGNAPRVTAAGSESQSFDPNTVTLNYIVGKEGWETDANKIWNGYKTEIWRSDFILGDVNLDEKIDVKDVYYVRLAAAKLIELNAEQKLSADVNGDGKINAIDANIIRKFALQIIDRFPIEA